MKLSWIEIQDKRKNDGETILMWNFAKKAILTGQKSFEDFET